MTLAQISDASQAVAAVAVVASLAILILQNYQANKLAREEAMRRQIEGLQDISRFLFQTPGMADVWGRGIVDIDTLSNEDKIRFLAFLTYSHRIWEALYLQHMRGQLDEALWRSHKQFLRDVQALNGAKQVWVLRKHIFSEEFQRFYEANVTRSDTHDIYALSPNGRPTEAANKA